MVKKLLIALTVTALLTTVGCSSNNDSKENNKNSTNVENKDNSSTTNENTDTESNKEIEYTGLPQFSQMRDGEEYAVMKTNMGDIKIRFFPELAPKAVENFITHAKNDYYDSLTFHRVINDFMIQGGDPKGTGTGGESIWGKPFEDEPNDTLRHFSGALSMANSGPNTNGSQFFIVDNMPLPQKAIDGINESLESAKNEGKALDPAYVDACKKYIEVGGAAHLDFKHTVFGQVFEGMDIVEKISQVETDGNEKPVEPVIIEDIVIEKFKK